MQFIFFSLKLIKLSKLVIGLVWKDWRFEFPEKLLDATGNQMWVFDVKNVFKIVLKDCIP